MDARPIVRVGRSGWAHHEGHTHGTFETWDDFEVGGGFPARKLHVFLPTDALHSGRRYPVVYLHDGDAVFWRGGAVGNTWDAAGLLDRLRAGDHVAPVILVAIHPGDRNAEYTHADWSHGARSYGRLPAFADVVADGVKAFVDAAYPTDPSPAATVVAGSSHGGLAAFWMAVARPDRFGAAVALSPSFFTGIDSLVHGPAPVGLEGSALLQVAHPTLADPARRPRLWISWGARRDGGDHNAVVEALAALRGAEMA
ncbi:MAG: alpha/beta hydrolase, partial [Myxococcota bacterium]